MSEQHAVVERMFDEIINEGDLDVADELFAAGYVDHGPMGDMQCLDAFKQVVSMWRAAVPDVRCTVENWFESGEMAAWNVRVTGTHPDEMMGIRNAGPPGSRAWRFRACTGSSTTQGPAATRDNATTDLAFRAFRPRRRPELSVFEAQ